jgi:hypothetical protein
MEPREGNRQTGVQFIAIAYPSQSRFLNVVESYEVVVSWYAVDGLDSRLLESLKEILGILH